MTRERETPYDRLIDVDITAKPDRARGIVRQHLEDADIRWPVDDDLVKHVEEALGVRLPMRYVELAKNDELRGLRGSRIELTNPAPPELVYYLGEGRWPVDEIGGLSYDARAKGLLASWAWRREAGLPDRLVLLDGDGHAFVALDYRGAGEPSVVFVEADEGRTHVLAPTFADFVERLRPGGSIDGE